MDRERFRVSGPSQEVPVLADQELILTAIAQLVDNAVKYSEPRIADRHPVCGRNSEVILTVRSKGIVVSPRDRERVFERFYRAPRPITSPPVRVWTFDCKEDCGGSPRSVWAEGEASYGTSFSLALPAAHAH